MKHTSSKTTAAKSRRTPKLRFPEFREDGEWGETPLDELSTRIGRKVGTKQLTPVSITAGLGFVDQTKKFGRRIAGQQYKNYTHIHRGDFVYNKGNSKTFPQGCIYQLKEFEEAAASAAFICFKLNEDCVDHYFQGLFECNTHGRKLLKFITSGARSDGLLNINATDFFSIGLPLPPRKAEQQKIATCLSSLGELIGAESRKLDALKAHKKWLMQHLFPREGETRPRLRFPEFSAEGEWDVKPLSIVAENLDNKRVPITAKDRERGEIPYYGASGVVDYVRKHLFDEDLLCVSEDGANLVARTYPIAFSISGKTWVNNHAHVLRFEDRFTQQMVESYLNALDVGDYLTGMAQPKLNKAMLDSIPIPLPEPEEREHVATCLSSLDQLTVAQNDKLEALNNHKKGLMQKLFPSPEDVQ